MWHSKFKRALFRPGFLERIRKTNQCHHQANLKLFRAEDNCQAGFYRTNAQYFTEENCLETTNIAKH